MNPPDYYPVPAEVLEAARLSITKALASSNLDPKATEPLTNMLMGGEWPDNGIYSYFPATGKNIYLAILYFLPSAEEKNHKNCGLCHDKNMEWALAHFKKYLDEPS